MKSSKGDEIWLHTFLCIALMVLIEDLGFGLLRWSLVRMNCAETMVNVRHVNHVAMWH